MIKTLMIRIREFITRGVTVSFGTNMTMDKESSDGNSMVKTKLELATAMERFHTRKFGAKPEKRGALNVNNSGAAKKQKNPNQIWHAGSVKGDGQG
jgi:hypothetical protein